MLTSKKKKKKFCPVWDDEDAQIKLNTKVQNLGKRYDCRCKCDNEIRRHIGLDGNAFQKTM